MRQPNFDNLLAVLNRERPERTTLFEFFISEQLCRRATGIAAPAEWNEPEYWRLVIDGFLALGYDFAPVQASGLEFPIHDFHAEKSYSMNETGVITDWASAEAYPWPNPNDFACHLPGLEGHLPEGMKLAIWGPGGVLENAIKVCGFDNLCLMIMDEPALAQFVFDHVGEILVQYFDLAVKHPDVGVLFVSDDWGFSTQTMLSPDDLRKYVFPWQREIVKAAEAVDKPAILHSCGHLAPVMNDVVELGFVGKHSYEDKITPVEQAYELWGDRIAILGGIDVDFLCRAPLAEIEARSQALINQTQSRGGYALGSGNSIPYYVPDEAYFAMTRPAHEAFPGYARDGIRS